MRPTIVVAAAVIFSAVLAFAQGAGAPPTEKAPAEKPAAERPPAGKTPAVTAENADSALAFTLKDIDGKDVPLSRYRGDVVIIVNVASKCGYTPQYAELEALYQKHKEKGLRIVAVPANNFGGQEPGSDADIKKFCASEYHVTFDLFAKQSVKGADCCELYKYLTSPRAGEATAGEIRWNFTKFVIGRDGKVVQRFEPKSKPSSEDFGKAIETALAAPKPSAKPAAPKP